MSQAEIEALIAQVRESGVEPIPFPLSPLPETLVMDSMGNLMDPLTGEIHVEAWT